MSVLSEGRTDGNSVVTAFLETKLETQNEIQVLIWRKKVALLFSGTNQDTLLQGIAVRAQSFKSWCWINETKSLSVPAGAQSKVSKQENSIAFLILVLGFRPSIG